MNYPESRVSMPNAETVPPVVDVEIAGANDEEEKIKDNILGVQHALLRIMVPQEIKNEFKETDGEQLGSFGDFLSTKWIQQYSKLFRIYVNQIRTPQIGENEERVQFRNRLVTGLLISEDYNTIRVYLEAPENKVEDEDGDIGGVFLATAKEIDDLKAEYRMSLN